MDQVKECLSGIVSHPVTVQGPSHVRKVGRRQHQGLAGPETRRKRPHRPRHDDPQGDGEELETQTRDRVEARVLFWGGSRRLIGGRRRDEASEGPDAQADGRVHILRGPRGPEEVILQRLVCLPREEGEVRRDLVEIGVGEAAQPVRVESGPVEWPRLDQIQGLRQGGGLLEIVEVGGGKVPDHRSDGREGEEPGERRRVGMGYEELRL